MKKVTEMTEPEFREVIFKKLTRISGQIKFIKNYLILTLVLVSVLAGAYLFQMPPPEQWFTP
jgi:hypothetical protein